MSDFSKNLCGEAVFHFTEFRYWTNIRLPQNVFFPNAAFASANGAFCIVSDILVLYLPTIDYAVISKEYTRFMSIRERELLL